ncbi:restriction endonuclease subunit R [Tessaracoccus aquimaris]|uniref:Restriction endonuclease subunit R n=1 Tax=Tessaracoccus aquimaris TaxID=1332264 RepID=A0A1Q2CTH0_9ACTN|nr:DEAD/DEAH box helicase family protein [Tessaracoccus aquimaris]AQP49386.1 restriction endonuclease subunit R [Tessaracoccus aquimaris]
MASPSIDTFREIVPLIYSYDTPDMPKYDGWEKIGYTEQGTADKRIAQQGGQFNIQKRKRWARRAFFNTESGGWFRDHHFHEFLRQQRIERETQPKRTEWHRFDNAPKTSLDYFNDFIGSNFDDLQAGGEDDYDLRPEQRRAVDQALDAFTGSSKEVLWNAKPRFGKTLTTYHLMRELGVKKALIVTNRPAIANSWYDDFTRYIGHQTTFKFVSESASLADRSPMTRAQWRQHAMENEDLDPRIVEFVSLQDLKGSQYFGGEHAKLKHIADFEWDLLVIDEAHEGVDTAKTDVAFDQIKRDYTLHLSGTPFKALASGRFDAEEIFNWTYEDEQTARQNWDDESQDNPYAALPTLNMLTYQVSRMITDRLAEGVAIEEDGENVDYTFKLSEFFSTKDNGHFQYEADVIRFLDTLTTNEKYPFSTPELRDEVRHSFWLLNRVDAARALQKLLGVHPVFKDYTVVLAAGDGRLNEDDPAVIGKSLDKVREAIADAEGRGGKTITLSVGQLTTGVTVPEWTAVIMLATLDSPAQYMQAAFRAQNPHTFQRGGSVYQKQNAYIFDFAPERTLRVFDAFANNLNPNPSGNPSVRQNNIRRLLNFFPILGEDSDGTMIELDASQVLTFPQVFKAREVVRRGFMSNLLFDNISGIFRYTEHVKEILDKLPVAKQGKAIKGAPIELPEPIPVTDHQGNVQVDHATVINPKIAELGKPVWRVVDLPKASPDAPAAKAARQVARAVSSITSDKRKELQEAYDLTAAQTKRDTERTEKVVEAKVERAFVEHNIATKHLEHEAEEAATEADRSAVEARIEEEKAAFAARIQAIANEAVEQLVPEIVTREEHRKVQKRADKSMDEVRDRLRGFSRTIPMFLMAYGTRDTRLSNFDDFTPDDVFQEITGITEEQFRLLRDGQEVIDEEGQTVRVPGLFDEAVFDQSMQEFLNKKEELADYFDESLTEDIFAYIPQPKTSLVFTPKAVVQRMVDILEDANPGIFHDPTKTFADLFSTAGLFLMELVRRLDAGLADQIPDQSERLKHILTKQLFELSHNEILHRITIEAVSGGVVERKEWMEESKHYRFENLATMTPDERQQLVDDMLAEGA